MKKRRDSGSVLILSLWTLAFLGALAVVVATYVESGIRVASRARTHTAGYFLARAGIEAAMLEVLGDTNEWDTLDEAWSSGEDIFKDIEMGGGLYAVWHETQEDPTGGEADSENVITNFGLLDEERKISINRASEALLKGILLVAGGLDADSAKNRAEAIIEWRGQDDQELTGQARSAYTSEQGRADSGRDGEFACVAALRQVSGIDESLFIRIEPYLTVHGNGKVNINTAGSVVLEALALASGGENNPAAATSLAGKIVAFRGAEGGFEDRNPATILRTIRESGNLSSQENVLFSRMLRAATLESTCFYGIASGRLVDRKGWDSRIAFVIDRSKGKIVERRVLD